MAEHSSRRASGSLAPDPEQAGRLPYDQHVLRAAHWTGLRLTLEGRLLLSVAAVLLLVGIFKNINLLALLANVLLALLVLSALLVGRRLRYLEARRVLPENLFAGLRAILEVRVHNLSSRRVAGARVEDAGSAHAVGWYFDSLDGHARLTQSTEIVLPARGWYDFAPLAGISAYPFGL